MAAISRILLPTGFAALSRQAAVYAGLLATAFEARLHVVHVVPHSALIVDHSLPAAPAPLAGPAPEEQRADARRRLEGFVRDVLPGLADRTTTFAAIGGVVDELLRYVHDARIDLVVMGTHADGMMKRMIRGSIGKSVLEGAPCPVLLVPLRKTVRE